jgi:hypothetical protein
LFIEQVEQPKQPLVIGHKTLPSSSDV